MQHKHASERHDDMADSDQEGTPRPSRVVARTAGALGGPEPFRSVEEERAAVEQIIVDDVVERMSHTNTATSDTHRIP